MWHVNGKLATFCVRFIHNTKREVYPRLATLLLHLCPTAGAAMLPPWMRSDRHILDISTRILGRHINTCLQPPTPHAYPPRSHADEDEEKTFMSFDVAIDASLPQPANQQ